MARISGLPAVRVVDVDQPVVVGQYVVTFWEALSEEGDQYASVAEVAETLLNLHELTAPDVLNLPELSPFANAHKRIATSTWLDQQDSVFLTDTLAQLQDAYTGLAFTLPGMRYPDDGGTRLSGPTGSGYGWPLPEMIDARRRRVAPSSVPPSRITSGFQDRYLTDIPA